MIVNEFIIASFQECHTGQAMDLDVVAGMISNIEIVSESPLAADCTFKFSGTGFAKESLVEYPIINAGQTAVKLEWGYTRIRSVIPENDPSSRIKIIHH